MKESFREDIRDQNSLENKKAKLKEEMTPAIYDYYYQFLFKARTDPLNDESKMR